MVIVITSFKEGNFLESPVRLINKVFDDDVLIEGTICFIQYLKDDNKP
jgi:hypothetical protein